MKTNRLADVVTRDPEQLQLELRDPAELQAALDAFCDALEPTSETGEGTFGAERAFYSLGYVCYLLQLTPADVRELMRAANVEFVCSINDVPHLDLLAVVKLNRKLRDVHAKIEQAGNN